MFKPDEHYVRMLSRYLDIKVLPRLFLPTDKLFELVRPLVSQMLGEMEMDPKNSLGLKGHIEGDGEIFIVALAKRAATETVDFVSELDSGKLVRADTPFKEAAIDLLDRGALKEAVSELLDRVRPKAA